MGCDGFLFVVMMCFYFVVVLLWLDFGGCLVWFWFVFATSWFLLGFVIFVGFSYDCWVCLSAELKC